MLYALPMMYRVQKEHLPDYYFCFTKIADPMAIVLPFKFLCHQGWFNKVILKIIVHYGSTSTDSYLIAQAQLNDLVPDLNVSTAKAKPVPKLVIP